MATWSASGPPSSGLFAEEVTLMEMFRVADGRIAELWGASQSVENTVRELL